MLAAAVVDPAQVDVALGYGSRTSEYFPAHVCLCVGASTLPRRSLAAKGQRRNDAKVVALKRAASRPAVRAGSLIPSVVRDIIDIAVGDAFQYYLCAGETGNHRRHCEY